MFDEDEIDVAPLGGVADPATVETPAAADEANAANVANAASAADAPAAGEADWSAKWDGELASIESTDWYASDDPVKLREGIKAGWQNVRDNANRLMHSRTEALATMKREFEASQQAQREGYTAKVTEMEDARQKLLDAISGSEETAWMTDKFKRMEAERAEQKVQLERVQEQLRIAKEGREAAQNSVAGLTQTIRAEFEKMVEERVKAATPDLERTKELEAQVAQFKQAQAEQERIAVEAQQMQIFESFRSTMPWLSDTSRDAVLTVAENLFRNEATLAEAEGADILHVGAEGFDRARFEKAEARIHTLLANFFPNPNPKPAGLSGGEKAAGGDSGGGVSEPDAPDAWYKEMKKDTTVTFG